MDESPVAKIKESLDSLHSALEGQNQFGIYQIDDDTLSELEQRVDFIDNPTLKDMYPIPNPDSFTQNYDATVGSRGGRAKFRLNQALTGNHKMATDLNGKIDMIYSELMRKFDALSEHIKRLDGQVAENAIAIKRETRRLPGRTDANPKRQINDVSLRSRRSLNPSTIEINQAEKHADFEKTGENRSRPIILESETPRESEQSDTKDEAIDLEEEEEELEIDRQEGTNVDRPTAVNIDRKTERNIDRRSTPSEPAVERVYKTLPPFPPKKMQTKRELDKAICEPSTSRTIRSGNEGGEGKALASTSSTAIRNNQDEAIRRSDIEALIKILKDNSCNTLDYLSEYRPIVTKEYRSMVSSSYRSTAKPPES
ncbi:hypothetical protein F2Q69_00006892 [Brassica cretica]|uniref:Uncharacterized protein n=1 Tax=Brassica cretica TaxID=69181 RepID=A0A8S9NW08_BRACR|nr:hypothetical protein F2Q69_00006892 [Brassica cretica]